MNTVRLSNAIEEILEQAETTADGEYFEDGTQRGWSTVSAAAVHDLRVAYHRWLAGKDGDVYARAEAAEAQRDALVEAAEVMKFIKSNGVSDPVLRAQADADLESALTVAKSAQARGEVTP